jgi:hypothetical protein
MDMEVLYDGSLPKQDYLHAWTTAKRSERKDCRLQKPMRWYYVAGGENSFT